MKIYTAVVTDRHSDPDIYTYESKQFAITNAIALAKNIVASKMIMKKKN